MHGCRYRRALLDRLNEFQSRNFRHDPIGYQDVEVVGTDALLRRQAAGQTFDTMQG